MKDGARGVQGRREDAGACATTMTDPGQRTSEKRKRPDAWTDGQEVSSFLWCGFERTAREHKHRREGRESDKPHGANDHEVLASQAEGRLTDSFFSRSRPFLLANRNRDVQSSLEDLTQQVKRLHASFEGKDGSLVVEKHEYASDMAHLEEYLHINQVLKHLHFDRLKRLEKMET